ncbi:MAG: hypothetical protein IJN78_07210 [Clostridia bacterium]|nr:hypothetical protein [Clostridia bacterium]
MGVVTAFIMVPFLAVFAFFGTLFGAITGVDQAKVELPYNEEQGLVWTCEENADWFSVTDVKIKGDKQVFTLKGDDIFSTGYRDDYGREEVIFTAENKEQVIYIATKYEGVYSLNINHIVELYGPDEYGVINYVPKAETPVDGAVWYSVFDENFYDIEGADGEAEFKLIYLPNPDETEDMTFSTCLVYAVKGERGLHDYYERILLEVELKDREAKIVNEIRQYYNTDNGWMETKPAT